MPRFSFSTTPATVALSSEERQVAYVVDTRGRPLSTSQRFFSSTVRASPVPSVVRGSFVVKFFSRENSSLERVVLFKFFSDFPSSQGPALLVRLLPSWETAVSIFNKFSAINNDQRPSVGLSLVLNWVIL